MRPSDLDRPNHVFEVDARRMHAQIRHAANIWKEIRSTTQPADRWIGSYFFQNRKKLGSRDRRFLSQTIYTLFRHKTYLSAWTAALNYENDDDLLAFLAAFLEGLVTEDEARYAAPVDADVLNRFLNRKEDFRVFKDPSPQKKTELETLALRYSFPEWIVSRWVAAFGMERTTKLFDAFEKRPPLTIRVNPIKTNRETLMARLRKQGFDVSASSLTPWAITFRERIGIFDLPEFQEGFFEVQDAGSQLACRMLGPKPGELIWDVCAGGGGKSLLLGALLENKGRLVATDIRPQKLQDLKKRAKRAGLFNVFPADLFRMNEIRIAQKGFDKILVDAPCSGTGTFRRNPDAKWKLREDGILAQQTEQIKILESVLPRLKVGGRVYYVTCSIEKAENEDVVRKVFEGRNDFRMVPLPGFGEASEWGSRLWPGDENDGFFSAAAEKIK